MEERAEAITNLWKRRMSDAEIADALGISSRTVLRWRNKLNLEGHTFTGSEKWRDPEKTMADIRQRATDNRLWEHSSRNKSGAMKGKKRSEGRDFN